MDKKKVEETPGTAAPLYSTTHRSPVQPLPPLERFLPPVEMTMDLEFVKQDYLFLNHAQKRNFIGLELMAEYVKLAANNIEQALAQGHQLTLPLEEEE